MALASVRLYSSAPIAAMQCYRLATVAKKFFEIEGKIFFKKVVKIFVGIKNDTIFV